MYSSLCTEIASHGYVVVAPEHTDGSACLAAKGGRMVPYVSRREAHQSSRLNTRFEELLACRNSLMSGRFAESVELSSCILMGHSFGGATALFAAGTEPFKSCCKVVILDPWLGPTEGMLDLAPAPTLAIMTGSMLWEPNASELVQVLNAMDTDSEPAFLTELIDARHQDISDVPFFLHLPMALISASSQLRSGYSIWKSYGGLLRQFLNVDDGDSEENRMARFAAVPGSRVHKWKNWVKRVDFKSK